MALTEKEEIEYMELLEMDVCERSLLEFVRGAWHTIEPATPYQQNWHIELICEYLDAVSLGQIKRLIISMPFRYGKSLLVSVLYPCWEWIHSPENRWLFASYSDGLSTELSIKRRRVMQSMWYQKYWGSRYKITTDQNTKTMVENNKQGIMLATSVGGSGTGKGGSRLVIDDPLKAEEAFSTAKRTAVNSWFDTTFSTRLNDRKKDAIIIVMHRVHAQDLCGHILAKHLHDEYQYVTLTLPLVAEKKTIVNFPVSKKSITREEGHILWQEKDGEIEIQAIKAEVGTFGWQSQCQQNPQESAGNMVKREWWQYYRELPFYDMKYQSWDTAFQAKEENAYSVCITAVSCTKGLYITDVWRKRVEAPELKRSARQLYERDQPNVVLIEEKASGHGLIQELRKESAMPIKAIGVDTDKVSRLNAELPTIEAGKVFLPESAVWVADFIEELSFVPHGQYWDQVDTLTQLMKYRREAKVASSGSPFRASDNRSF